jgi:hypothetical protein
MSPAPAVTATHKHRLGRAGRALVEALPAFVVARVIVLSTLALAHFIVDRTHPSSAGVAARVHEGLLGWDAGWYETIARAGYTPPLGHQSIRFFPSVPLLTHVVAWFPGIDGGAALLIVSNVAALVATALLFVLVRRETGDAALARRTLWVLSLGPAAFVLVMGYAESVLLCLVIGCFLALRPSGAAGRPNFVLAAALGFAAALTRPIGVLVALAVVAELVRWWPRLGRSERVAGLGATVGPVLGLAAFLGWAEHEVGDVFAPLRVQLESSHHGGLADPFVTLLHDARGVLHGHVGTALHVPWVLVAAVLLVVCWRRLPASYTLFAAAVLGVAVAGTNLDSFERYALSAFPVSVAGAMLLRDERVQRAVFTLLGAGLAGYALLAFLNISVP